MIDLQPCDYRFATSNGSPRICCGLVQAITGTTDEELSVVDPRACKVCATLWKPDTNRLNLVVASLIHRATSRIIANDGVPGCDVSKAQEIQDRSEADLAWVPRSERAEVSHDTPRYISNDQLVRDTRDFLARLPHDVSGIAGIPRSGIFPASLLALLLHVPLYEISPATGLREISHGYRLNSRPSLSGPLLVLDDSVYSGRAIAQAKDILARNHPKLTNTLFASLYVFPERESKVDLFHKVVGHPHLFEWNLFNSNNAKTMAVDFDGILCSDWTGGNEDESQDEYLAFLQNAAPRWLPRRSPIPLVVTARLEKHRQATLNWLARHQVEVRKLVMTPWTSAAERRRNYHAGEFKGQAYAESDCSLFIESDPRQARSIFETSGKMVVCPQTSQVFY